VVAGRLFTRLAAVGRLPCDAAAWGDTCVKVPFLADGARLSDVLDGRTRHVDAGALPMAQLWESLPGAVLVHGLRTAGEAD
jgi:hypothetical protein